MFSELATCTSARWDAQRTVMKLQQQIEGSPDARLFFITERAKVRSVGFICINNTPSRINNDM